jgi:multicomponent Na+:H+ antiporter subunit C
MILLLILSLSLVVGAGVLLVLSRDTLRIVVGLAMLGGVANLAVFLAGRPGSIVPPIIPAGAQALALDAANPLPQALVLTAIVIGFALLCFALVLIASLSRHDGLEDGDAMRAGEPIPQDPVKPPLLEP